MLMKLINLRRFTAFLAILVLFASFLIPAQAVAQGNGRGRGQAKKFGKFVNGHDARDGRWDGRGPRPRLAWTSVRVRRNRGWVMRRRLARRQMMIRRHNRVQVLRIR
jgi:hypothetical protein